MKDIFDAKIICEKCDERMTPLAFLRSGSRIRAVECPECKDKIMHPGDMENFHQYNSLKGKTYIVKLRMVGNSHAISIPKEVIDFINTSYEKVYSIDKHMDDMVKLCFEDFGRLSLQFFDIDKEKISIESFEKPLRNLQNTLRRTLKEEENKGYSKSSIKIHMPL